MHYHPQAQAAWPGDAGAPWICPDCHYEDGSLNTEKLTDKGVCTFGCGRTIDRDRKFCAECQDHSANQYTCEGCGTTYGDWEGSWQVVAA